MQSGMKEPYKKGEAKSILTSSLAPGAVRSQVKCRQRHRRARNRASKNTIRVPTECLQREGNIKRRRKFREVRVFDGRGRSPRAVRTLRNCTHENRETSLVSEVNQTTTGPGSQKRNPGRKANEESNMGVVPMKPPNRSHEGVTAEAVEGRPVTKENIMGQAPTQLSVGLVYGVPKRLA